MIFLRKYSGYPANIKTSLDQKISISTILNKLGSSKVKEKLKKFNGAKYYYWDFQKTSSDYLTKKIQENDDIYQFIIFIKKTTYEVKTILYHGKVVDLIHDESGEIGYQIGWGKQYRDPKPWKNILLMENVRKVELNRDRKNDIESYLKNFEPVNKYQFFNIDEGIFKVLQISKPVSLQSKTTSLKSNTEQYSEGIIKRVEVNRYERDLKARKKCLEIHGVTCKVCSFNFNDFYGDIGGNFIHVHHILPLSQIGKEYSPEPEKDLVPVCPNCHAMLHSKEPPYTVYELKLIISK